MNAFGWYWASQYRDQFGSWTAALDAVGVEPPAEPPYPPDALADALRDFAADSRSADPPTKHDMAACGRYHPRAYIEEYGTWDGALRAAGLDRREATPEATLSSELQRLATRLGHTPSGIEMNAHGAYQRSTYRERVGSWRAALEAAGLEANVDDRDRDPDWTQKQRISREALLEELETLADDLGRVPVFRDMQEQGPYAAKTYQRRFGSWSAAVETALADWTPPTDEE
jgi:hypothetical protein